MALRPEQPPPWLSVIRLAVSLRIMNPLEENHLRRSYSPLRKGVLCGAGRFSKLLSGLFTTLLIIITHRLIVLPLLPLWALSSLQVCQFLNC